MNPKDPNNPSGPVTVRGLTVKVDRDLCIGAATCAAIASKTFGLDEHSKAIILDTAGEDQDEQVLEAAKSCPVIAIIINNEKSKQTSSVQILERIMKTQWVIGGDAGFGIMTTGTIA